MNSLLSLPGQASRNNRVSRSLFLLALMAGFAVLFSQLFFLQLEGHQDLSTAARIACSNRIFSEFLLASGLIVLLANGRPWSRIPAYVLFALFVLTYVVQYAAVKLTGAFLSPTALENTRHIGLIMNTTRLVVAGAAVLLVLIILLKAEFRFRETRARVIAGITATCLLAAAALEMDRYWLSEDIQASRFKLYHFANNYMVDSAPFRALVKSMAVPWQSGQQTATLTSAELETADEFGISYRQEQPYPLLRERFYQEALPFPGKTGLTDRSEPLNVIVFMSEGLSSRIMQPYDEQYPGLTPNIDRFADSAMRVDRYFNHSFATYRGLLGQLCSFYPFHGGGFISYRADYYCLGKLFNQEGYETHFLFSQQKKRTQLDEILAKAEFRHILAQDDLRDAYLEGEAEKRYLALSDQQLFRALNGHLSTLEAGLRKDDARPFFLGVYNIETHAWFEMSDDGVKYPDADNYILDAIHNFDNAFGSFWDYFVQSELYDNTVVIFTSDHAHFQGKDFRALVDGQSDYQPYFVDRIPLLIYHPKLQLPANFDARNASAVDFAPTVAHLMELDNRPNAFLGHSLFERDGDESLAFGDGNIYLVGPRGIAMQTGYLEPTGDDSRINQMYKVIQNIHALESQGRIWDRAAEPRISRTPDKGTGEKK